MIAIASLLSLALTAAALPAAGTDLAGLDLASLSAASPVVVSTPAAKPVQAPAPEPAPVRVIVLDAARLSVKDGDTLEYAFAAADGILDQNGAPFAGSIRLDHYDCPEVCTPEVGLFCDQPGGREARATAAALVKAARRVELLTRGRPDRYGRLLGVLVLDGEPLGATLVRAGLAYELVSVFGDAGCPSQAAAVLGAWGDSPLKADSDAGRAPLFERPYLWRQKRMDRAAAVPRARWDAMTEAEREALRRAENDRAAKAAAAPR